jgi:hypothetical protein
MGGGHGFFSNRYGLGVDNVLEFEIVTPAGDIVIANDNLHQDLFWALRGGGGGTFGVVTKVTMKTYPHELSNAVLLTATPGTSGLDGFVKGMTYLMSVLPEMTDWGLTGHMLMQRFTFSGSMNAPGKEMKDIFGYLKPISQKLWDLGVILIYIPIPDSINSYLIAKDWDVNSLTTSQSEGYPMVQSSRLLGRSGLKDTVKMEKALKYYFENNYIVEPFNVAGGAVARNKEQMALNPAWRETYVHMSILPLSQLLSRTVGEVEDQYKRVQKDTEYLDEISINSGSYLNEVS